jgi:hypothetical protein
MADALSCLGPTANDLVKDYAKAYASMKENMEIRLRHEQRRGDFLQVRLFCSRCDMGLKVAGGGLQKTYLLLWLLLLLLLLLLLFGTGQGAADRGHTQRDGVTAGRCPQVGPKSG